MTLTTIDPRTALVVIDLQKGIAAATTQPYSGTEVVARTAELADSKRNWGAFYGTDLDLQLRRRGITQIVLTGIATSIGVESTARSAYEHGYNLTLATDAMADMSETSHRHSVEVIFPRLGETGTSAEIVALLTSLGN